MGSERHVAFAVALALGTVAIAGAGPATADPPDDPDHGVNETTFPLLWSGDEDGNLSSGGGGDNETIAMRQLASGTDIPFNIRDEATGAPINTAGRTGYVVLEGERVNTTNNGTVSVSLDASGAMVTARYEPGGWWHDTPGYQGDSQTVTVGGMSLQLVATLFRFVVPVGLFLLAVYFVDRVTRWQIWPPWRGL